MNKRYMDFVPVKPEPRRESGAVRKSMAETAEVSEVLKERAPRAGVTVKRTNGKSGTVSVPKAHFVNTEKVTKRPLSKNVYPKKTVVAPKEESPSKPIRIIDKPEKDSKTGLVGTILITIILGAAAGTVAFLLLPK